MGLFRTSCDRPQYRRTLRHFSTPHNSLINRIHAESRHFSNTSVSMIKGYTWPACNLTFNHSSLLHWRNIECLNSNLRAADLKRRAFVESLWLFRAQTSPVTLADSCLTCTGLEPHKTFRYRWWVNRYYRVCGGSVLTDPLPTPQPHPPHGLARSTWRGKMRRQTCNTEICTGLLEILVDSHSCRYTLSGNT